MLFIYGTLQDPDILGAALGRHLDPLAFALASAPGYRAVAYPGRVYPALVPSPADTTPGLVIDDLSATDMQALDAYEGDEYRRATIAIVIDAKPLRAETYLPVAAIAATGAVWSLAHWTNQHKPDVLEHETQLALAARNALPKG